MTERPMQLWSPQTIRDCILSHVVRRRRDEKGREIIEPAGDDLIAFANRPKSDCKLFVGPPGTGKSVALKCLLQDIWDGNWPSPDFDNRSELSKDRVIERHQMLKCSLGCTNKAHVHLWAIDEFAKMSQEGQEFCKSGLDIEVGLPPKAIVLATSNDVSKLQPALLQRFDRLEFPDSIEFRHACLRRVRQLWHEHLEQPFGVECPDESGLRVLASSEDSEFSFRSLLRAVEQRVERHTHNTKPAAQRRQEADEHAERIGL